MPARVDQSALRFQVEKQIGSIRAYRQFAIAKANEIFDNAKERFFQEFDESEVTKEIEAGPDAFGSELLPGGYGNLFSLLGFEEGEQPIEELRAYLEHSMFLVQNPITGPFSYTFRASIPNLEDVAQVTPMPWGTTHSWVTALEEGIPGFNRYLFDLEREFSSSRSGPAVQTDEKHVLREAEVSPIPYLKPLFESFKEYLHD